MSFLKDAGFAFCYSVLAAGGLYLYEHALTHETCFSVLVAAWVTVSVMNHVSAQKRSQEPINKPYALAKPRMFMFKRMLRAALLAVPLFLDVFTSSNDEVLSTQTGLRHEQLAEDSVRCGGASLAFIFVLFFQRNILLTDISPFRKFVFVCAGLSLSVGPLLGMQHIDGRVLAATTAALRVLWLCLISTHVISDVTDPVSTIHTLRVLSFGVLFSIAANVNSCLMFSGMGLGVACWSLFSMQSPLLALCVVTLVGGFLSEDQIQVGVSILSVGLLMAARFPCSKGPTKRNTRFHKMKNNDSEVAEEDDGSEI